VLLRTTWESLQAIVPRVTAQARGKKNGLAGLSQIGIDEKSWGTGDGEYIMVVTDHCTGKIVWAAASRCQDTVCAFFAALGPDWSRLLTHVSADGAEWIHDVIGEHAPQAQICLDPFHLVKWAGKHWTKYAAGQPPSCAPPRTRTTPRRRASRCARCARHRRNGPGTRAPH
jgi:transposase